MCLCLMDYLLLKFESWSNRVDLPHQNSGPVTSRIYSPTRIYTYMPKAINRSYSLTDLIREAAFVTISLTKAFGLLIHGQYYTESRLQDTSRIVQTHEFRPRTVMVRAIAGC